MPNVRIVDNSDLLKNKPYGTFKPQPKSASADSQVSESGTDDHLSKPPSEDAKTKSITPADKSEDTDTDTDSDNAEEIGSDARNNDKKS